MHTASTSRNDLPLLVVVSGAPGSGKTTLAAALAKRLRLLHIERDLVLWGMRYTANGDIEREKKGIKAYYEALANLLQSGVSLVTDGTLYRGKSEPDIKHYLLPLARIVNVHCRAEDEHRRFYARELERHNGEAPDWLTAHMQHLEEIYPLVADPLEFGAERIEVTTTDGYDPSIETIVAAIGDRNRIIQKENQYGS